MAIKYVGAKRIQGTNAERIGLSQNNDTLGSSADGTNTGVTLIGTAGTDSGTANANGTGSGITYGQTGKVGNAISFDGSNDYIYFPDTPDTNFTFGAGCTVSWNMWYKASSTGQSARLWSQARGSGGGSNERGVTFGIVSGTGFNLFASTSNSDYYLNGTDANVIPNDTNWHMLTVTFDEDGGSNNLKIYIDGSSVATRSGTTSGSASNPAYYPNIGRMVSATEYFAGLIDEYSIWSRVLTTSEITALYNSGNGAVTTTAVTNHTGIEMYYPMNESSGTVTNVAGLGKAKLGTGCYKFNGSSGYTSASISSALQSQEKVSIAFWYKRSSSQSSYSCMFSVSNNVDKYKLEIANDNSNLWIYMSNNSSAVSGYGAISDYATTFPVDTWVHVAYVYDGSQSGNADRLKLYINGVEKTLSFSGTVEATTPSSLSLPLDIGRRGYGGGTFYEYGAIDDMGIWTRALTATEIEKLVNNNQPVAFDNTGNQNGDGVMCKDEQYFYGQQIGTGHSAIGTSVNRFDILLQNNDGGSLSGYVKGKIYSGSVLSGGSVHSPSGKTLVATSTNQIDVDSLSSSSFSTETFEFASDRVIAAGDVFGVQLLDGGSQSGTANSLQVGYHNAVITDSLICRAPYGSTNGDPPEGLQSGAGDRLDVNYPSNYGLSMKLYNAGATYVPQLVSSLTDTSKLKAYYSMDTNTSNTCPNDAVVINPTIATNTIFEETDTAKYRWWDGSEWKMDGTEAKVFRGLFMGGYDGSSGLNSIEYITIPNLGNSTDFGDLTETKWGCAGGTNGSRGLRWVGQSGSASTASNVIDYVTIATPSNATDFGDLSAGARGWIGSSAMNNNTRSVIVGGLNSSNAYINNMDYVTVATTGNSSDFGDFLYTGYGTACCDDKSRGVLVGGRDSNGNFMSDISYITISTTGNATNSNSDMGYGSHNRQGTADDTRGVFFGGYNGSSNQNRIQYITIQSLANAIEFGDMSATADSTLNVADNTRAVIASSELTNDMEYITIQTLGNSANYGDMITKRDTGAATQGY